MPKWLAALIAIILILLGGALMYVIDAGSHLRWMKSDAIGPADFISIILTALGVILAAMTLILGLLAVVGWTSIQTTVERKVEAISKDHLKSRFGDEDKEYLQFVEDIKEDIRLRMLPFVQEIQRELKDENLQNVDPDA